MDPAPPDRWWSRPRTGSVAEGGPTLKGNHILITVERTLAGPRRRVAIVEDGELVEVHFEVPTRQALVGNIYKGRVETVLPGMGAAFVNVGEKKALFLSEHEINDSLLRAKGFEPWKESAPIQKVIRPGDAVVVQVRREGMGKKNPQGTTKVSLPGRYWVFLPTEDRVGVSRRVSGHEEAHRLRQIAYGLKGEGQGLIARTAALRASEEDLEFDFRYLRTLWEGIAAAAAESPPPRLLHQPLDLVRTLVRDRFLDSVGSLIVDDAEQHEEVVEFLDQLRLPRLRHRVRMYRGTVPLFVRYDIERRLREVLQRRIPLKAGGFLVVDETEALTAIDVNTGSDVRHRNQDAAILSTNLEAAREIPRILRLRKISGIIIVDFVDMESGDEEKVMALLAQELKKDRVPADLIGVTKLGLVEITRRREGESLVAMIDDIEES
ncbi:MAG TPA: Rne/Rng family ribonuclease [Candidatus Acetothermia bacterium]|nr:Rne/Rng family ribonuclease [Candidatus Acetothermia bacterium]